MAERRLKHSLLWVGFLAFTFTGAGLLFTPDTGDDGLGLALILAPLLFLGALMALYYWKSRQVT